MTASGTETEIKIPVAELQPLRARLLEAGAVEKRARHGENNTLYDDAGARLSQAGCALRLRIAEGRGVVTFKGPASFNANVKSREELQTGIEEPEAFRAILQRLGFVPRFRYEKRRQELEFLGCTVCLDETPIGCFVEVEGEAGEISEALRHLGLSSENGVRDSYAGLYARARGKGPISAARHALFPMRAFVLAAGLGTRFRPATWSRPKALLPHLNVALIDRRLAALRRAGVSEVAVNLHHEGRQIVEHLGEGGGEGVAVSFFWEPEILGTAGALKNAERFLGGDDFLVWNVDAELEPEVGLLENVHRSRGAAATLLAVPNPDPARFTPIFAEGARLVGIGGDGDAPLLFTGVSIHSPGALSRIGSGFRSLVDDLWRPMLAKGEPIGVAIHRGEFFDLGSPADLLASSLHALESRADFQPREGIFDRDQKVLSLERVPGVALRRCVLGRAFVARGARLEDCVLWDGAQVEEGAVVTRCLVGPVCLHAGVEFRDAFLWPGTNGKICEIPLHGSHRRSPSVK